MSNIVGRSFTRSWLVLAAIAAVSGCNCSEVVRQVFGEIEVAPSAIDFKKVSLGSFATHAVDVHNTGTAPLFIESLTLTDAALSASGKPQLFLDRVLETDCEDKPRDGSRTIGMGDCARFRVRYSPLEFDAINGVVTIESSDPSDPVVTIPVSGHGGVAKLKVCVLTEEGALDAEACTKFEDPDPETAATVPGIDFGALAVGDTRLRQVRIFNEGDYPLTVSDLNVASDFPDFTVASGSRSIAPGREVDVDVAFVPKGNGNRTGRLVVISDDLAHPRVELPLTARANGPLLCIQPHEGLDFGAVPVLEARTLPVKISNCGLVPFEVASVGLRQNGVTSPVDFALVDAASLALPSVFEPGASIDVDVSFKPTAVANYTAELSVVTAFETRQVPLTGVGAAATCAGTTRPTAALRIRRGLLDITDHPIVQPLDSVLFDGSSSTVPRGGATYAWRLVSQPQNGVQNVVPRAPPSEATLFAALDGEYVVELVVGDAYGCDSVPVQATLQVRSKGKVHVQLTWAQSFGDLDLHFLGPNGVFNDVSLYGGGSDCFFANCRGKWGEPDYSIDWGLSNTTSPNNDHSDDPTLDIDELWGHGPENVTHASPFDATYSVIAHYFCSRAIQGGGYARDSSGPVDATMKIFVNGEEAFAATQRLTQRDKWLPATINVSDRGSTITVVPSSQPVTKSTGDIEGCTPDTD